MHGLDFGFAQATELEAAGDGAAEADANPDADPDADPDATEADADPDAREADEMEALIFLDLIVFIILL